MINKLLLGAFALSMATGAALADTTTTTNPEPSVFDKEATMSTFYTDTDMKTLKSEEEFRTSWMALTDEDRDQITRECDTDAEKLHNDFCAMTKKLGGAN